MFDIGWSELLVIAVVMLLVVGPKDLPRMLRAFGKTMGQVRRTANDFKRQFDDALREAEREADLVDTRKQLQSLSRLDPLADVKKELRSVAKLGQVDTTPTEDASGAAPREAEPAKTAARGAPAGSDAA